MISKDGFNELSKNYLYNENDIDIQIGNKRYRKVSAKHRLSGVLDLEELDNSLPQRLIEIAQNLKSAETSFIIYSVKDICLIDTAGKKSRWQYIVLETNIPIEDFYEMSDTEIECKAG